MPTLPIYGPTPLDGGDLPVSSTDDVLAVLPPDVRDATPAPVRDALVAALTEIAKEYQRRSSKAAAQADTTRATTYLPGLASDHGVQQQDGESIEALRTRLLGAPALVTPAAILAGVNAILASHTTKTAEYFEAAVDCWFVGDGSPVWSSHVYDPTAKAGPHYADRLYADDSVENSGNVVTGRGVLGAWAFGDEVGRYVVLRIPALEAVDNEAIYAFGAADVTNTDAFWVADGSDTAGSESDGTVASFGFTGQGLSDDLYAAIVSFVDLIKGQGIRWQAFVDTLL